MSREDDINAAIAFTQRQFDLDPSLVALLLKMLAELEAE